MENQLQVFNNDEFGQIRVIGDFDNPRFCLSDVCRALEIGNPSDVKKRLDDDLVTIEGISDGLGRLQNMTFITEAGLYDLLIDSRKPKAKKFRKWLTSEVAVSIRKTGSYSVAQKPATPLADAVYDIRMMAEQILLLQPGVNVSIAKCQAIDFANVKYEFNFNALKQLLPPVEHETGYLNPTQIGEKLGGLPPRIVNKLLADTGLQYKDGKNWRLTELGKQYGEEMPYTRNGHSGYQIRWNMSVIDYLAERAA